VFELRSTARTSSSSAVIIVDSIQFGKPLPLRQRYSCRRSDSIQASGDVVAPSPSKSRREGLVSVPVDLAGSQVFSGRLLARARELETQPLNFLD
jgi:hypothetical protein